MQLLSECKYKDSGGFSAKERAETREGRIRPLDNYKLKCRSKTLDLRFPNLKSGDRYRNP